MITQTTVTLSQVLAAGAGGEESHHNAYLVGVSVMVTFIVLLLATLSFNRER